jgi:hypothetical protein
MELVYYESQDETEERFSFFVIPSDGDGIENLAELYLYHDREGLRWLLSYDDWVSYETENQTWIGSRNIAMAGGEVLPRGLYRAALVNKGGERSERTFSFDAPEEPRHKFPSFSISDGIYRIDSGYENHYFIAYDAQGNHIKTLPLENLSGSVADLTLGPEARSLALWAQDPEYYTSALTEVVSLR